jgi:hypothetical protein
MHLLLLLVQSEMRGADSHLYSPQHHPQQRPLLLLYLTLRV